MTAYEVNRSTTNTLTSTTADTITLTQLWGSVRVTNQHTSNWLYATPGGETAVAEADGTVAIPPGQSRTFKAERAEGTNTVVVGVVGNGNVYTVEGMQGTLDEALDDLTAEVDTLANATSALDSIWLGANDFRLISGAPAQSNTNQFGNFLLDAASDEAVGTIVMLPAAWTTYKATLYWTNGGAGTGDVVWVLQEKASGDGESMAGATYTESTTIAAPAASTMKATVLKATATVTAAKPAKVVVTRDADAVGDTLANDAAFIGLLLEKVT